MSSKKYTEEKWNKAEKLKNNNVKVKDIVAETGIPRSTFYRHFNPKMRHPRVTARNKTKEPSAPSQAPETSLAAQENHKKRARHFVSPAKVNEAQQLVAENKLSMQEICSRTGMNRHALYKRVPEALDRKIEEARNLIDTTDLSIAEICKQKEIDKKTLYHRIPEAKNSRPKGYHPSSSPKIAP